MNPIHNDHNHSGIIERILHFPLIQIIIGIFLVNVPTFILRSIAQFILSSLSIENDTLEALAIFFVRSLAVYFAYILFVQIFEKRKAQEQEISINASAFKEFSLGGALGLFMIAIVNGPFF